jgi:hypothetical protein
MEGVQVMSKASADQAKKAAEWPQEDSSSTITKRDFDAVEKEDKEEGSSKKTKKEDKEGGGSSIKT